MVTPITKLLTKEGFAWTEDATATFNALKRALSTAPVLQLQDFNEPFMVECEASGSGIGAVLHQGHRLVAFFIRNMAPHHSSLVAYERELIALA